MRNGNMYLYRFALFHSLFGEKAGDGTAPTPKPPRCLPASNNLRHDGLRPSLTLHTVCGHLTWVSKHPRGKKMTAQRRCYLLRSAIIIAWPLLISDCYAALCYAVLCYVARCSRDRVLTILSDSFVLDPDPDPDHNKNNNPGPTLQMYPAGCF